ncbi:MAG: DUF1009 domain-containing protein [Alphaproteobacteria bacterium]|nr:MAG: DUF1009 domain-containing protein [Alphaproteobacteria bacterium]
MASNIAPIGMIAGTGDLPQRILRACSSQGRDVFIIAIKGQTPTALVEGQKHLWCRIGAVGQAMDALRAEGISDIVMAGGVTRPSLPSLMPDSMGRALLKRIGGSLIAGDDALLSRIVAFFEEQGFRMLRIADVTDTLTADLGVMTHTHPSAQARNDAKRGYDILMTLSPYDLGQAIIVSHGHVLGIEAVEGTAALLQRCAHYPHAHGAVLVKLPKQGQSEQVDMPAVGLETVEALHHGGYAGMMLAAHKGVMIDKTEMIARANDYSLFIEGMMVGA